MIKRDFDLSIKKKEVIKKEVVKKEEKKDEPLSRVLIIGPNYPERCHFSENIYDLWKEREGYDIKIIADLELPVNSMHIEKGLELPLTTILNTLEEGWIPQLIIYDQVNINIRNNTKIPVFYHHRNYFREPRMFYPSLVWFWHEDILNYYKNTFKRNWMAQVQYHELMYIAVNPNLYPLEKKKYEGINLIGFRELPNEIDDMFEVAPQELLQQEYDKFCTLGLNVFESPIMDNEYREILPQCEAVWCPLSRRQYTSRRIIEAMVSKTLVVLKLENKRHEEILEKIDFYNGKHYIGVKKLEDIKEVYEKTKNKQKIIENAYEVVLNNHTYENRIDQIIKTYEGVVNKSL